MATSQPAATAWIDPSPHRSGFVSANGIRLHYLDWGGRDEPLLFLTGMGNSAHVFDDLAPQFTERFRVLALTRRGHAQSDKPAAGYDNDTLVQDIHAFLDALRIARVNLVGHSMAGGEMTRFAALYPERVGKLVYLDAAYDRARLSELMQNDPAGEPSPGPADIASFDAFRAWYQRTLGFWSPALEADLREVYHAPDGALRPTMPRAVAPLLLESMVRTRPEYDRVRAPALAFYALQANAEVPDDADPELRRRAERYVDDVYRPWQREQVEGFRRGMACGRAVEMLGAHHYLFIERQDEIVRQMWEFLLAEPRCPAS